jgi:molybdopterin-containing oxidoreductase family iron-sulfur binding subunit
MAASLALAGAAGCTPAPTLPEKIVPYVRKPEDLLPGKPLHFATAMPFAGYGTGLIVTSDQGRPIKIEGNPRHPASLGATDVFIEASILSLYDPDRSKSIMYRGAISTLDSFVSVASDNIDRFKANGGAGLRLLSGTITSPSEGAMIQQILRQYPNARWHQYEPVNNDNARQGEQMAFGRFADTIYHFDKADVVLSLDSDFLYWGPAHLRYTREFSDRRVVSPGQQTMNRLYVFESVPTITGMKADHRIPLRPSEISRFAVALAASLSVAGVQAEGWKDPWFEPLVRDLQAHRGATIVIPGQSQPPHVHALAHAMNAQLGNVGQTVEYREPVELQAAVHSDSIRQLTQEMANGQVQMLVMWNVNPIYDAPAELKFADTLKKVPLSISHGLFYDETAAVVDWHVPAHHYLEAWGDLRSYDGTVSIVQPLIEPLYETRSTHEFLSVFAGTAIRSNYEMVRDYWSSQHVGSDFEGFWTQALQEGIIPDARLTPATLNLTPRIPQGRIPATAPNTTNELEVLFRPDPNLYDGRFANNAWLLELPQPITHLTWDNAVLIGPKTAEKLQAYQNDVVEVTLNGRKVTGAVFVIAGQSENTLCLNLGWGRQRAGQNGSERGFAAYGLRTSADGWNVQGGQLRKVGQKYELVSTRDHHGIHDRHMVRHLTQADYASYPDMIKRETEVPAPDETLYDPYVNIDYAWGMSVDLSRCVGCNACVIACQAENNIPIVGKTECARGREMHWMRIDTYFEGNEDNPEAFFQPMFCQHCENAPCEYVCPVEATSHSSEGLNEMTYNRCIGTRYCSNNCPYKVRRFNFFQYTVWDVPSLQLLYNPDVTVRSRGVMEKCTYCVQRINRGRIDALKEDRKIRDGEVLTACQQACPANALVFGNLLDQNSGVFKHRSEQRNYAVLADLNTRPRTNYLATLKNPNPDIASFDTAHRNG